MRDIITFMRVNAQAKMNVTFVTSNEKKMSEVRGILRECTALTLHRVSMELPELQGEPEDVARAKAKFAAKALASAVLVEDTSLCFNALHGLPGVYVKEFLHKLGHDGLRALLTASEDKSAYAQCVFAYARGPEDDEPLTFVGRTQGRIVKARGANDFGWDPIFAPDGYDETYAEMDAETKNAISHRFRALDKFRAYVSSLDDTDRV